MRLTHLPTHALRKRQSPLLEVTIIYLISTGVLYKMSHISKYMKAAKKQENVTHVQKRKQTIESYPEMAQAGTLKQQ